MKRSELKQIIKEELSILFEAYKPYKGGAGPDQKQVKNNDIHLMKLLKKHGVKDMSYKDMSKQYGIDPPFNLIIIKGKNGDIYAGYDRWGYVIEGPGVKGVEADQVSDKEALDIILNRVEIKESINEAEQNAQTMEKDIEKIIKKYFPKSYVDVYFSKNLLPHITIVFAIGQKKDWSNGIFENDPMSTKMMITGGFNDDGTLSGDPMEFEKIMGKLYLKSTDKFYAYDSVKLPVRKKKGDYNSILKAVDSSFAKMKQLVKSNLDKLDDSHQWVKKYV